MIHNSGTNKLNLATRLSRGWGKVNEILAIIKEAPLGRHKIMSGMILRKAMLFNTMLFTRRYRRRPLSCSASGWQPETS